MTTELITNEQHYELVTKRVAKAQKFVWIGTADIKDLHVKDGRGAVSFLYCSTTCCAKG